MTRHPGEPTSSPGGRPRKLEGSEPLVIRHTDKAARSLWPTSLPRNGGLLRWRGPSLSDFGVSALPQWLMEVLVWTRPYGAGLYSLRSPSHPRASRPVRVTIPRVVASLRAADGEPASIALGPGPAALLRARAFGRLRRRRRLVGASRPRKTRAPCSLFFHRAACATSTLPEFRALTSSPPRNAAIRFHARDSYPTRLNDLGGRPRIRGAVADGSGRSSSSPWLTAWVNRFCTDEIAQRVPPRGVRQWRPSR